jgi:hypothetical protein
MTGATTTVTVTATTSAMATKVIVVMITMMIVTMIDEMTDVMIDVARTTTVPATTTERSGLHRHHPKWGNSNGAFQKANREINFIVGGRQAIKSDRNTRSNAREIGHVNTENPRSLRWSEFPITFSRKDHWVHIPDPGTYPLVVNPIVNRAWLPKTLINGGSSLNIIFTETLRKMEFDFSKMTACDEPFYGVVPGKAAYPISRVCLPVTFGTEENIRTEYLRDIMFSYNCETATIELSKDSAIKVAATVMVAQAARIDQTTLQVPKQKCTTMDLDSSPAVKNVCLGLPDASKEVVIVANLDPK